MVALDEATTIEWPHDGSNPADPYAEGIEGVFCGKAYYFDAGEAYGMGFPTAIIREGFLELSFTDMELIQCIDPYDADYSMLRIPVSEIGNPQAYLTAKASRQQYDPRAMWVAWTDMKWSPQLHRYVHLRWAGDVPNCDEVNGACPTQPDFTRSASIRFSISNPDDVPPHEWFTYSNVIHDVLPTCEGDSIHGRYYVGGGGIAGDHQGNTLDFNGRTDLHLYYPAETTVTLDEPGIDHLLLSFASGADRDCDGAMDYCDNCLNEFNPNQQDSDGDGRGDACDCDAIADLVINFDTWTLSNALIEAEDEGYGVLGIMPGSTDETLTISQPIEIVACDGLVTIGQ